MGFKSLLNSAKVIIRSRIEYIFIWTWAITVPCLIVGKGFPPLLTTFKAIFSMMFISISVYAYNDLIDRELDKQNTVKNNRPLATGQVSTSDAMNIVYFTAVLGIVIGATLNVQAFSFIILFYVLFATYSWPPIHLKRRFLMKEMIIMSGNVITAIAASYAIAGTIVPSALFMGGLAAAFALFVQPALWDTTDMDADRLQNMKTLAMLMGWKAKIVFVFIGVFFMMAITLVFYSGLGFSLILPLSVVIGGIATLAYTAPLYREYDEARVLTSKKVAIAYWTMWQVASILAIMNITF
jgi:4-hydroxybenzoate polyprenyltransferase